MNYYEVCPATNKYYGGTLTYSFAEKLEKGQAVEIKIRNLNCLAVVEAFASKPEFKTNPIIRKVDNLLLTKEQADLYRWLHEYYPENKSAAMNLFIPSYLSKYTAKDMDSQHPKKIDEIKPKLNKDQLVAYKKISKGKGTSILNGVTGSGKTRVYMELARDQINLGKSVLVLTPEISLTAPLEKEFRNTFGDIVITNHSNLTPKQKLDLHGIIYRSKTPLVLIGPRSNLFLPLNNIGLIVVDEFHENSYKQETSPKYHANRVASKLSEITGSKLLFGSATPPVSDYYLAEQKNRTIVTINTSAITEKQPEIYEVIADLSNESEQTSYPMLSKTALGEISRSLDNNEQALVYINKRGSFRSILCKQCGWQFKCLNCDLPLIYHHDIHSAICHTCGYRKRIPHSCPSCKSLEIFFTSPGTKSIADTLAKSFPSAKIRRYDRDNKKSERAENNYQAIQSGDIDIIVGTQMIAKGFDLPKLSLVVMIITESALSFPDYTSDERSYQLIKQLSGRVNRGHRKGKVVLQTFSPKSEVINYSKKDWIEFYKEELAKRKSLGFPPFWNAVKIQASNKDRQKAEKMLGNLADNLRGNYKNIKLLGPSPSFVEKKLGKFYWQIIIMSRDRKTLVDMAKKIPQTYKKDMDPINFL